MNIEQTKEAIRVMQAFVDGNKVEASTFGELWSTSDDPSWNFTSVRYRIKPTPTFRPWTADEVPLGAQMRRKIDLHRFLIGSVANDGSRKEWLEHNEHSTDCGKTWHPCGVMEEAK